MCASLHGLKGDSSTGIGGICQLSTVQKYFIKQPPQKKTCTSPKICLNVRPYLKIGENLKWIGVDVRPCCCCWHVTGRAFMKFESWDHSSFIHSSSQLSMTHYYQKWWWREYSSVTSKTSMTREMIARRQKLFTIFIFWHWTHIESLLQLYPMIICNYLLGSVAFLILLHN